MTEIKNYVELDYVDRSIIKTHGKIIQRDLFEKITNQILYPGDLIVTPILKHKSPIDSALFCLNGFMVLFEVTKISEDLVDIRIKEKHAKKECSITPLEIYRMKV